ncbi:MAG TPA: MarR family transcriptional regulator [Burkholderiales bacterium]|nr:MarR family transcriptional regulator [Burkholderiales bacterium]
MTSSKTSPPRRLELRLGSAGDALDRFEAAWNRAAGGAPAKAISVLSMKDLPLLLKTLSPARWALLGRLKAEGPMSIYELAKRLERDYKNVHTDVARLAELGLIERRGDGAIAVPWETVRAELDL